MYYYLSAIIVLITIIFGIVIARLIMEIHKLNVHIKTLNEGIYDRIDNINKHIISINNKIEVIATVVDYRFEQLDVNDQCIRKELKDELIAIGKTTTEQADIMLNIEKKLNELELERPDKKEEKEGDAIESERIPADCTEDGIS